MPENLIIVDANFILLPFQFKIDYLREINHKLQGKVKFIIYQQIIDELKAKAEREKEKTKFSLLLNSSLSYLERYKNDYNLVFDPLIKSKNETSDEFLLRKSIELKKSGKLVYLATCDRAVKKQAKSQKINLIFIRQKKMILIERA